MDRYIGHAFSVLQFSYIFPKATIYEENEVVLAKCTWEECKNFSWLKWKNLREKIANDPGKVVLWPVCVAILLIALRVPL